MRQAVDLQKLGEFTIAVDCDVLQADGGTRVSSITGAWVALAWAIESMIKSGALADRGALLPPVAAISVGIVGGEVMLDLPYEEDSRAEVDMNVVMNEQGKLIEVQGTGENASFNRAQLDDMLDVAHVGIDVLCKRQREAAPK